MKSLWRGILGADANSFARAKSPVDLDINSLPEPDVTVASGNLGQFLLHHPMPHEIEILAEVDDASYAFDKNLKLAAYASNGIREYWILYLFSEQLGVHREPTEIGDYRSILHLTRGDTIAPLGTPNSVVNVSDLLPTVVE